jgi:hypothetical protein
MLYYSYSGLIAWMMVPLWTETRMNIVGDIYNINISGTNLCILLGQCCESVISNSLSEQYKFYQWPINKKVYYYYYFILSVHRGW